MCPDSISTCYIANWQLITEAIVVSMVVGLIVGAAVDLVANLVDKRK